MAFQHKLESFFDENNDRWLRIYKICAIVVSALLLIGSIAFSLSDAGWEFVWNVLGIDTETLFGAFLIVFVLGSIVSFLTLVVNMLIVQVIGNIKRITNLLLHISSDDPKRDYGKTRNDDLVKLLNLKEQGVLSEEEFNKLKTECLERL